MEFQILPAFLNIKRFGMEEMMRGLWYKNPAKYWEEALPVGNGRLGAMIYGRFDQEIIQLNEESVWSGSWRDRTNPDCLKSLESIRESIRKGRIAEAEQMTVWAMSGLPQYQRCYQTMGNLYLNYVYSDGKTNVKDNVTNYRRTLNLEEATAVTVWEYQNTVYRQEVFASKPADLIVIRLSCKGKERLCMNCRLDRDRFFNRSYAVDSRTIGYEGGMEGISFCGLLRVMESDGTVSTVGEHLILQDATEAVLCFSAHTSFGSSDPCQESFDVLSREEGKGIAAWKAEHIRDYQHLFDRVRLTLHKGTDKTNAPAQETMPTDERLKHFAVTETDPGLVELYFDYGRYLMISGSREGSLPLTLQGIWNEDMNPPWDSKYTININLQMNYWPVDLCNLSECAEPFFTHLKKVMENGKKTAELMYGCKGFVAHHNTDIHGDTVPQDHYIPASYWVMGGAWLATHIWDHYQFTKDRTFLAQYYEVLRQAVLFFCDFLIQDEDGCLVTSPSVSPENTYILPDGTMGHLCDGPAMDCEIMYELFHGFLNASEELQTNDPLISKVYDLLEHLPPLRTGKEGQLLEWKHEYEEAEPGHRHISHLYGVFPGTQITVEDTPELAAAARISLEKRLAKGGGHTGWSRAWIVLLWDRFKDGDKAYENLRELIGHSTYSNLMDFHPLEYYKRGSVFQIDGNMGGITGIVEMLVQSHCERIDLLPSLPKAFPDGRISGIKIRGGASADLEWEDGKLIQCTLDTTDALSVWIKYGTLKKYVELKPNTKYRFDRSLNRSEIENGLTLKLF